MFWRCAGVLFNGENAVLVAVVVAAIAISLFVHQRMTQIRRALPAEVLEQQRAMSSIARHFSELIRELEVGSLEPSPQQSQRIRNKLASTIERLRGVRRAYTFDSLVGASAMHALANPALEDIQRWLDSGINQYPPDSPVVMNLAHQRASETFSAIQDLFKDSNDTAVYLLNVEVQGLERLRDSLVLYIGAFALFVTGVVVLFIRQREAERRIAVERKRLHDSIDIIDQGIVLFDQDDHLIAFNQRCRELYPDTLAQMVPGTPFSELARAAVERGEVKSIDGVTEHLYEERMARHRRRDEPFEMRLRDGRCFQVNEHTTQEGGSVCVHTDVSDLKRTQERLEYMAFHDSLTGLHTRRHFEENLTHAIGRGRRLSQQVGVVFFDLDHFKRVNDTYGHMAGDRLLVAIAQRLRHCLREDDVLARFGGDEFAAILENVGGGKEVATSVERMVQVLSQGIDVGDAEIYTTASIGVAMFPQDGSDLTTLLRNADNACYHAKSLGRNRYQFYTEKAIIDGERNSELEAHPKRALDGNN